MNLHSTTMHLKHSSNFRSDKDVRSSNIVEFEFKLGHIPSKYTAPFYFCSISIKPHSILIIFGKHIPQ